MESLKKYLQTNQEKFGRLVIKCEVCECNTRAKVIVRNNFISLAAEKSPDEKTANQKADVKLCTNCEDSLHAIR